LKDVSISLHNNLTGLAENFVTLFALSWHIWESSTLFTQYFRNKFSLQLILNLFKLNINSWNRIRSKDLHNCRFWNYQIKFGLITFLSFFINSMIPSILLIKSNAFDLSNACILLTRWSSLLVWIATNWKSRLDLTNRNHWLSNRSNILFLSRVVRTLRLDNATSLIRRKLLMILNLLSTKIHFLFKVKFISSIKNKFLILNDSVLFIL